jgi:hypothetical protein
MAMLRAETPNDYQALAEEWLRRRGKQRPITNAKTISIWRAHGWKRHHIWIVVLRFLCRHLAIGRIENSRTVFWVVRMWKRFAIFCALSVVFNALVDGNAASTLKLMCTGELTNTREDGVTLDQCDLNFISVKEMDEIEKICGIPGTIDSPAENQCRIRVVASPDPSRAADHRKLYKVLEVWSVDKRRKD